MLGGNNGCSFIFSPLWHFITKSDRYYYKMRQGDDSITGDYDLYVHKRYDKRHSYSFFIVCIQDLSGNIPAYVFIWFSSIWIFQNN